MVLTQLKGSFKRWKRQLGYAAKGSDEQPDVAHAPDGCFGSLPPPPALTHAAAQCSPRRQQARHSCPSNAHQAHDHSAACQLSPRLKAARGKGQRDCDVFLAVPGADSSALLRPCQHQPDGSCSNCTAERHPSTHNSLHGPSTLRSVAESAPMLIAAGAGTQHHRPACCTSSSGSSSSDADEDLTGGSHTTLSRGSSWGNMGASSEEWNAEAGALQAACTEALRAGGAPQVATPTCAAAESPARLAQRQQRQQQQQAGKGLAPPFSGFFRGLLGRTRSAPMADAFASAPSGDESAALAGHCSSNSRPDACMLPVNNPCNTGPQPQVLMSAASMPDCCNHGAAAAPDRISTWGFGPPVHDRKQQQPQQQRKEQQQSRDALQQQSPFYNHRLGACGARSNAPVMVAVEPLQPPSPTQLLAVSEHLPRRMARTEWCLADFSVVRKMYKGAASSVYHATDRQSGMSVALKVYHMERLGPLNHHQVHREVRLHAGLAHENIICLYAAFQEGQDVVMVQEYAEGGDLYCVLHRSGGRLSERQAVELVLQPFLLALHYMHTHGILHRDIKPENVLFTRDSILKVADFGLAIDLNEEYAVTRAGTLDYMAPEVLRCPAKERPEDNKAIRRLQYTNSVDSWAVGVFAYELVVGFPPFASNCAIDSMERIMSGPSAVVFPKRMSEAARGFIGDALQMHPGDRPTVREMLLQPWVAQHSRRRSMRVTEPHAIKQVLASHRSVTGSYPLSRCANPRALPLRCHMLQQPASPTHGSSSAPQPLLGGGAPRECGRGSAAVATAPRGSAAVPERWGASPPPLMQLPRGVSRNATTCALLHESAEALQRWELACRRASATERPPLYRAQACGATAAGGAVTDSARPASAAEQGHQAQQAGAE